MRIDAVLAQQGTEPPDIFALEGLQAFLDAVETAPGRVPPKPLPPA